MRWSLRIARVAGIEVRLHVTFVLILVWIGLIGYEQAGWPGTISSLVLILSLFACVLLHEFGHALAAARYGIRTPDITLLPIGGVARMQRMPDKPVEELVVALAGPAVNVVIAAVLFLVFGARFPTAGTEAIEDRGIPLIDQLMWVNVVLVVFNLIPAFPMDGGRVLRSLLAMGMSYGRATQIAARIGQGLAVLFGLYAIFETKNPFHMFIAFFVYMGASQEAAAAQLRDVSRGLRVAEAMVTQVTPLSERAVLDDAVDALLRSAQHEFPVLDDYGRVQGVLTRDDMIAALKKNGGSAPVTEFMRRELPYVHPLDPFDEAFRLMQECNCPALPVVDREGRLIGLITPENVGELMLVHSLRPQGGAPAWRTRPPPLPRM